MQARDYVDIGKQNDRREKTVRTSGAAAANERSVLVVRLVRQTLRSRPRWTVRGAKGALGGGDKLHFPHEAGAPSLIDPTTEFASHDFELLLPCLPVGGQLKAARDAAYRPRMRGQRWADDRRPRAR